MKILMPEWGTLTNNDIDLSHLFDLGEVIVLDHPTREELKNALEDVEILLVNKTVVDADLLSKAEKLQYIGECATGFNNIDLAYCREHDILVTNVPAYSTSAVAQQVFGYLLEFYGRTHDYNELVQNRGWIEAPYFSRFDYPTEELDGKTIGLIGYGQIARKVAKIANGFGMNVIAYSRSAARAMEQEKGNTETRGFLNRAERDVTFVSFENLLKHADIVSVHCPLNEDSLHMFTAETFHKMKKGAFFINTARGPVVDEAALAEVLRSGHLAGAGLDVLEEEPMSESCPLLGIENCLITPHVAWAPKETRQRLVNVVCKNLECYLHEKPQNVVS